MAKKRVNKEVQNNTFSFSTVRNFDNHIHKQIKTYDVLDTLIKGLSELYIEEHTGVYDIGCSTGRLLTELNEVYKDKQVDFYGIELNTNFAKDFKNTDRLHFLPIDITKNVPMQNASMAFSIFTLQFIAIHKRQAILNEIYKGLNKGGCFIWAEKVVGETVNIHNALTFQHFDIKRERYSGDEILDDEKSLRSIMKPVTKKENEAMLEKAGFTQYETFWRYNNFLAWIVIK